MTYEVWLYGSRARGDADGLSDTDVLVIGARAPTDEFLPGQKWRNASLTFYSWQEIESMWRYGSLFLHHIRDEGLLMHPWAPSPHRVRNLLATLPAYSRASFDLAAFQRTLIEAEESLRSGGWPDVELSILATVARHAAILACHCIGQPRFGRTAPFRTWTAHAGWSRDDARRLSEGSVAFRFAAPGEWPNLESLADDWLCQVHRLLDEMEVDVARYEDSLLAAS